MVATSSDADVLTDPETDALVRRSRAAGFDRLVESNLDLTESVRRLVSAIYVLVAVGGVGFATLALLVMRR